MTKKLKRLDKLQLDYERKHGCDHFFNVDEETRALYEELYPLTRKKSFLGLLSDAFGRMTKGLTNILTPGLLLAFFAALVALWILKEDFTLECLVSPKGFPVFCVFWFLPLILTGVYYLVKNRGSLDRAYVCGMLFGICYYILMFIILLHFAHHDKLMAAGADSSVAAFTPGERRILILSAVGCFVLFYLLGPLSLARKNFREQNESTGEEA